MSFHTQILQQSNLPKDSSSGNWLQLPFIEKENTTEPIILIDSESQTNNTPTVRKRKRNTTNIAAISLQDSTQTDTLVQAEIDSNLITGIENSPLQQGTIQPSFFQDHSLQVSQTESINKSINNPDWFSIILITLVIGFTYIKYHYDKIFKQLLNAFLSTNASNQIIREENVMVQRASIILSIIFYLAGGLFLYQLAEYNKWDLMGIQHEFSRFLLFALFLAFVSPLKMIVLKILGFIFESDKLSSSYSFNIFLINNILGLLLIPIIAVFAYLPFNTGSSILYIGVTLISLAFIYRLIKGYSIWQSIGHLPALYFILYLCTLEIAPILVLLKYTKLGI